MNKILYSLSFIFLISNIAFGFEQMDLNGIQQENAVLDTLDEYKFDDAQKQQFFEKTEEQVEEETHNEKDILLEHHINLIPHEKHKEDEEIIEHEKEIQEHTEAQKKQNILIEPKEIIILPDIQKTDRNINLEEPKMPDRPKDKNVD